MVISLDIGVHIGSRPEVRRPSLTSASAVLVEGAIAVDVTAEALESIGRAAEVVVRHLDGCEKYGKLRLEGEAVRLKSGDDEDEDEADEAGDDQGKVDPEKYARSKQSIYRRYLAAVSDADASRYHDTRCRSLKYVKKCSVSSMLTVATMDTCVAQDAQCV